MIFAQRSKAVAPLPHSKGTLADAIPRSHRQDASARGLLFANSVFSRQDAKTPGGVGRLPPKTEGLQFLKKGGAPRKVGILGRFEHEKIPTGLGKDRRGAVEIAESAERWQGQGECILVVL